jgi:hypothetical protein
MTVIVMMFIESKGTWICVTNRDQRVIVSRHTFSYVYTGYIDSLIGINTCLPKTESVYLIIYVNRDLKLTLTVFG